MDNRGRVSAARGALAIAGALAAGAVSRAVAQPMATTPVVRTGQAAPGTGATYSGFSGVSVNASGEILFGATLSGPGVTDSNNTAAFFGTVRSAPRLLLREGDTGVGGAAGTVGNVVLAGALNGEGQGLVSTELLGAPEPVATFVGTPGSVVAVQLPEAGSSFFGMPVLGSGPRAVLWRQDGTGLTYWQGGKATAVAVPGGAYQPTVNRSGRVVVASGSYSAAYAGMPGDLRAFATTEGAAPGAGPGATFDLIPGATQNDAGQVALNAWAVRPGSATRLAGVWAGAPDDLRVVALDGAPAAGLPGYRYSQLLFDIDSPTLVPIGGGGHVGFTGEYVDEKGALAGFAAWAGRPGDVRLLGKRGDVLPLPGGGAATMSYFLHNQIWVNEGGQVALLADSSAGDPDQLARTLLAADTDGALHLIARRGSPFEVSPGSFKTVSQIWVGAWEGSGGQDGRPSALGDGGDLVYQLDFDDGSSGIFVTAVPEPTVLGIATATVPFLLRRRRPRRPE